MTDPNETTNVVGEIIQGYREHAAAEAGIVPVPARVLGSDIEAAAADLAEAAGRLGELLAAFAREPGPRSMDAAAVFRSLAQAAESVAASAVELGRQEREG